MTDKPAEINEEDSDWFEHDDAPAQNIAPAGCAESRRRPLEPSRPIGISSLRPA